MKLRCTTRFAHSLNQVIGYAEMLQEQAKELGHDSFASDLQKVHTAGRRLLDSNRRKFSSIQVNSDAVGSDAYYLQTPTSLCERTHGEAKTRQTGAAIATASLLIVDDNGTES